MDRYIEMGYSEESATLAVQRFGDDLHAGCHWLMMRETMGRVPKRLKVHHRTDENTYIGSKVRFRGVNYVVSEFDAQNALVRLTLCNRSDAPACWEHISDARIEWTQVRHQQETNSIPKATWHRVIGHLELSFKVLGTEKKRRLTSQNALNMYIRDGRPTPSTDEHWSVWRAVTSLTREYIHTPSRPMPRGNYSRDIHSFRLEMMSYFLSLCDVHSVSQDTFTDTLFNASKSHVLALFPDANRPQLSIKIDQWHQPQQFLKKQYETWRSECLPLVKFRHLRWEDDKNIGVFQVLIHDMTFVQPSEVMPGMHINLQRLFFEIFPKTKPPQRLNGPIDTAFLDNVLRRSKKVPPLAQEPSEDFKGELFPYQKRCLRWLIQREMSHSTSAWGWTRHELSDGFVFHTSAFGHFSLSAPNDTIHGGLLAQEVGMGKTVEMLALIATNRVEGPTMVVVPTTMLAVWEKEASIRTPSLNVIKFHGARRTKEMDVLRRADIVITTYRVVVNETRQHVPTIGGIRWGRIVLDESHELRSVHTATTRAICRLFAPRRWCISATPWPKAFVNVASMVSFLSVSTSVHANGFVEQWANNQYNARHAIHKEYNPTLFSSLLSDITWWQKKRHVRLSLPPVEMHCVELANPHQEFYSMLLESIRIRIELDQGQRVANSRARLLYYARWLKQAATHVGLNNVSCYGMPSLTDEVPSELDTVDSFVQSLSDSNYDNALRDIIASWRRGNETCCICQDAIDRPTLTPCHHVFCFECIQTAYHHDHLKRCPLCRTPAGASALTELTLQDTAAETTAKAWRSTDNQGNIVEMTLEKYHALLEAQRATGAKFEHLLHMVKTSKEKFIVFTQFHSAWEKMCDVLRANHIGFASIEGRMSPLQRAKAIEDFQTVPGTRVFVMTTKTASVGITLTAGSQIVFLEPCDNAHLRKQAIGRAWRIGQTKKVHVTTLKMKQTIDMVPHNYHLNYLRPAVVNV